LTYPYTAETHTGEYSIQRSEFSPLKDALSVPLAVPSVIFGYDDMTLQGLCAEIRNHW